jgi:molybdopterin synthase sulfur carrier subunit
VTLLYFSWVRQKIGQSEQTLELPAGIANVRALVVHLAGLGQNYRDAFADLSRLRVAVNQEHVSFDSPVSSDDEVAFFPPVTGG